MSFGTKLSVLCISVLSLAGCGTKPLRQPNADGTYCYQAHPTKTCTQNPIPPASVEQQARLLQKNHDALTLYFVRSNWGDVVDKFLLSVDGARPIEIVPHSFVRIALAPGDHQLVVKGKDDSVALQLSGAAGDLVFVEFAAQQGLLSNKLRIRKIDPSKAAHLIFRSRMVSDE